MSSEILYQVETHIMFIIVLIKRLIKGSIFVKLTLNSLGLNLHYIICRMKREKITTLNPHFYHKNEPDYFFRKVGHTSIYLPGNICYGLNYLIEIDPRPSS